MPVDATLESEAVSEGRELIYVTRGGAGRVLALGGLQPLGWNLRRAPDARTALRILQRDPRKPHAALLDLRSYFTISGSPLTEAIGEKLLGSPLRRLRICVDTIDPEIYPHLRTGGDWHRLVELTRAFLEQAKGHPIRIEIQKMRSSLTLQETVEDFRKLFDLRKYKNARVVEKTCEALDVNEETDLHGKFHGCVQGAFFNWIVIFADGRVTHCCYDAHGDQVIGDLKTQSLREMIDSERFAAMFRAFESRDFSALPRCGECFKHGGESVAFNDVLARMQTLPGVAKDVVRKVIDARYRA